MQGGCRRFESDQLHQRLALGKMCSRHFAVLTVPRTDLFDPLSSLTTELDPWKTWIRLRQKLNVPELSAERRELDDGDELIQSLTRKARSLERVFGVWRIRF